MTISGYASTDDVDSAGEIVPPSSIVTDRYRNQGPLLFAHNPKQMPIGVVNRVEVRPHGLWCEASIPETWPESKSAGAAIRSGALASYSIGFRELAPGKVNANGNYVFSKIELIEVSCVPCPMNQSCLFEVDSAGKLVDIAVLPDLSRITTPHLQFALQRQEAKADTLIADLKMLVLDLEHAVLAREDEERHSLRALLDPLGLSQYRA